MNKVTIADLHIDLTGIDAAFFNRRLSAYGRSNTHCDMRLTTIACDEIEAPQGPFMERVNATTIVQLNGNRFCKYLRDRETGQVLTAAFYDRTYSEVEIHLWKGRKHPALSLTDLEYIYTGFAFNDRLTKLGGTVLHGSAIAMGNRGIVFSASSGTGKSTHVQLWKKRFGEAVTVVNDDKPAIRFYDGVPYIFGTPWSGKTDLNANVKVPLTAIVFIQRAATNRMERLNVKDSVFCLTGQIDRPFYDSTIGLNVLDRIEQLVAAVPIYKLHCNISQAAVDAVYDEIIGKKGYLP